MKLDAAASDLERLLRADGVIGERAATLTPLSGGVSSEIYLVNAYIPEYQGAGRFFQHEPRRKRRLLLHAKEIHKLSVAVERQGMTIVPLELYFNARGIAKLKLSEATSSPAFHSRTSMVYCGDPLTLGLVIT